MWRMCIVQHTAETSLLNKENFIKIFLLTIEFACVGRRRSTNTCRLQRRCLSCGYSGSEFGRNIVRTNSSEIGQRIRIIKYVWSGHSGSNFSSEGVRTRTTISIISNFFFFRPNGNEMAFIRHGCWASRNKFSLWKEVSLGSTGNKLQWQRHQENIMWWN